MVQYNPLQYLPSSAELPDSDDTPVDNEFQNLIPNLLLGILAWVWQDRADWFFGVDMGLYHTTGQNPRTPIVPDGFLSLGVERRKGDKGRLSYVLWEENYIVPCLALEVVSQSYGGEYDKKKAIYATLGVLYYVVYNPDYATRDKQDPLEVYRLVEGEYIRQIDEPVWMPEIGLGIGRGQGSHEGWEREWLYWYDQSGNRLPTPEERANQAEQELEFLVAKLREKGINPELL
jgi:Uma2 family endonuclease